MKDTAENMESKYNSESEGTTEKVDKIKLEKNKRTHQYSESEDDFTVEDYDTEDVKDNNEYVDDIIKESSEEDDEDVNKGSPEGKRYVNIPSTIGPGLILGLSTMDPR